MQSIRLVCYILENLQLAAWAEKRSDLVRPKYETSSLFLRKIRQGCVGIIATCWDGT